MILNASSKTSKRRIHTKRNLLGTTIAELPLVMWIVFVGICMPLLSLVLTTVRYALFMESARQAADVACSAQTYSSISGSSSTPATTLAQDTALAVANSFSGITVNNVECSIITTPLAGGASITTASNQPLSTPPDPSQNLYQICVNVTGQIQPMLSMPIPEFINIPGLSAPLPAQASMVRVFQNPPGLYNGGQTSTYGGGNGGTGGNGGSGGTTTAGGGNGATGAAGGGGGTNNGTSL